MLRVVTGKPRSGKSYWLTADIVETLKTTKRCVWTNLPIDVEAMHAGLGGSIDVLGRVHVETDLAKVRRFWRYRMKLRDTSAGEAYREPDSLPLKLVDDGSEEDEEQGPAGSKVRRGGTLVSKRALQVVDTSDHEKYADMAYYIDEAHLAFGAREWAKHGPQMLFYFSQHGKLGPSQAGDQVVLATQAAKFLDSQIRDVTQDWVHCRNLGMLNFATYFRLPSRVFFSINEHPGGGAETKTGGGMYKIDPKGIGSYYRTTSGVGVVGSSKGKAVVHRAKGLPIWVAGLGLLLVGPGLGWVAIQGVRYIGHRQAEKGKEPVVTHYSETNKPAAAVAVGSTLKAVEEVTPGPPVDALQVSVRSLGPSRPPVWSRSVDIRCVALIGKSPVHCQVWVAGEDEARPLPVRGRWVGNTWVSESGERYRLWTTKESERFREGAPLAEPAFEILKPAVEAPVDVPGPSVIESRRRLAREGLRAVQRWGVADTAEREL